MSTPEVLLIEPFYGGSHKQLMDLLATLPSTTLHTLPDKKWHWRARTSALYLSQTLPVIPSLKTLFTSSVLNLAELIALRPDLSKLRKIVYFHENQLIYPVQQFKDRDFQFGYNQILTCLVADVVLFNSHFNMTSFLDSINTFLNAMPDHKPKNLEEKIRPKCRVLYFPIQFQHSQSLNSSLESQKLNSNLEPKSRRLEPGLCIEYRTDKNEFPEVDNADCSETILTNSTTHQSNRPPIPLPDRDQVKNQAVNLQHRAQKDSLVVLDLPVTICDQKDMVLDLPVCDQKDNTSPLHILWPHRWEHDKNPQLFFRTLLRLKSENIKFKLSVLGEQYSEIPEIFVKAKLELSYSIVSWGYQTSKDDYYKILNQADLVVSTAQHEFFGVAMLEAVKAGCLPLCPNRLVYPEIYPQSCLYNTDQQLYKKLKQFCESKIRGKWKRECIVEVDKFSWNTLKSEYEEVLFSEAIP